MSSPRVTEAHQQACAWLADHNGTGVFARDGVLLAAGERAPIMRSTWNKLRDLGHLTIVERRASLTISGQVLAKERRFDGPIFFDEFDEEAGT